MYGSFQKHSRSVEHSRKRGLGEEKPSVGRARCVSKSSVECADRTSLEVTPKAQSQDTQGLPGCCEVSFQLLSTPSTISLLHFLSSRLSMHLTPQMSPSFISLASVTETKWGNWQCWVQILPLTLTTGVIFDL